MPRYFVYLTVLLIAAMIGGFRFQRIAQHYKLLTLLVFLVFCSEVMTRLLGYYYGNSMPSYHALVIVYFLFYGLIYGRFFLINPQKKWLVYALIGSCITFSILNMLFIQSIWEFPSYSVTLLSFVLILSVLFDFRRLILFPSEINIARLPDFWFNLGGLVFYSITFFGFGFINLFMDVPDLIYDVIYWANIFMYTCYGVSIYLSSKRT